MGNTISLRASVIDGDVETLKKQLDEINDAVNMKLFFDSTPLHLACEHNHLAIVNELLNRGAGVNAKDFYIGYTPLHWAAECGHVNIIEALLLKNADVNVKVGMRQSFSDTFLGSTALHLACCYGRTAAAIKLISAGADVNIQDREGR